MVAICLRSNKFAYDGVEIWEETFVLGVWVGGVVHVWPCSVSAYWEVCRGEYDVREYLPVHHSTRASVSCVIEGNSSVGFDFPMWLVRSFSSLVLLMLLV